MLLRIDTFGAVLREQIKTVNNCFYRSECAETRSRTSEACLTKIYDYVSSARTRRTSQRFMAGGRPYPLQRNKKVYCKERYYAEYFRFGTKILARICYRKCHAQIALVRFVAWGFAPFWYGADPFPSKRKTVPLGYGFSFGADYGARTRHLHLGKVALYQMS